MNNIPAISKTKAALYAQLGRKKIRDAHGWFVAEGTKCVLDTIGSFEVVDLVATQQWLDEHSDRLPKLDYGCVHIADATILAKISSLSTPPEAICVMRIPSADTLPPVLTDGLYLMLDGVQDPGNLGTIVRVADWFGIDLIFASNDTVDIWNPKSVQATMGSLSRVKVVYCNLQKIVESNPNLKVYGTLLDGEDIYTTHLETSGFIVMGNEGKGMSAQMRNCVTDRLLIPSYPHSGVEGHPESLNVGVATALTVAEFRRRSYNNGKN